MAFTCFDQFEILCRRKCGHLLQKGPHVPDGLIHDPALGPRHVFPGLPAGRHFRALVERGIPC